MAGESSTAGSVFYAKYAEGRDAEGMVEFLKNEYGQSGKGFEIGGHPVSVWFAEHGMSVGYGTQAKEAPIATMDWEDAGSYPLYVENGTYMSKRSLSCGYAGEKAW